MGKDEISTTSKMTILENQESWSTKISVKQPLCIDYLSNDVFSIFWRFQM